MLDDNIFTADWDYCEQNAFAQNSVSNFTPQTPTPRQKLFLELKDEREVFYGGAAGGGKSSALLMDALRYVDTPNYSALLLRRTYADLSKPGALMDRAHSWLKNTTARWNEQRKMWTFPSGARLSFGYLENENDKYNYQSAEFQFIGFDELTHFRESQYTYMFSRLRRLKDARVPIRMRGGSNPGGEGGAWVKARFIPDSFTPEMANDERVFWKEGTDSEGNSFRRAFVPARLDDNPHLDQAEYEESLTELDSVTRLQLRRGDWQITVSGDILYMWSERHIVISWSDFERVFGVRHIPTHWLLEMYQDWGTTKDHPCVTSWFATAGENSKSINGVKMAGSVFLYRGLMTDTCTAREVGQRLIEKMSPLGELSRLRRFEMSHEASSERLEYKQLGLPATNWQTGKTRGIEQLKNALTLIDGNKPHPFHPQLPGHPKLYFIVDDNEIENPTSDKGLARWRAEAVAYKWNTPKSGEPPARLEPYALFNDACFVAGTLVTTARGNLPIEKVTNTDLVLTRQGFKRTSGATLTNANAEVRTYNFSDGTSLTATRNHPIYVNKNFISIDTLRVADTIEVWKNLKHAFTPKSSHSTTRTFIATHFRRVGQFRTILTQNIMTLRTERKRCILRFINFTRQIFQRATTFTTRILTPSTTTLTIFNVLAPQTIGCFIKGDLQATRFAQIWTESDRLQVSGTKVKSEGNGTKRTVKMLGKKRIPLSKAVSNAAKITQQLTQRLSIVRRLVNRGIVTTVKETLKRCGCVHFATNNSQLENMQMQGAVQIAVVSVSAANSQSVFNLSVEECPEYFANNLLVHNCDSMRAAAANYFPQSQNLTAGEEREATIPKQFQYEELERRLPAMTEQDASRSVQTHDFFAALAEKLKKNDDDDNNDDGYFSL